MIKKNLKIMLLTSAVILLPMVAGVLLWDRLPGTMNLHWGADGTPDGGAGKAFAVFGPSLFILATHWLCMLITSRDPKNQHQTPKAIGITLWICPVLSLFVNGVMLSQAMGARFHISRILLPVMGVMFMVIGNYMPKFRQNSTMGIKTAWALADEENWNATHRFGGKVWLICGLLMVLLGSLLWDWAVGVLMIVIVALAFLPVLYSWILYKERLAAGKVQPLPRSGHGKWSLLFIAAMAVFLFVLLCTGNIEYRFGDDALTVDTARWDSFAVSYDAIDTIELREEAVPGIREWGFGSLRLLLGSFRNDEFGMYTRCTYTGADCCVILTVGKDTLVLSAENSDATRALYQSIIDRIS